MQMCTKDKGKGKPGPGSARPTAKGGGAGQFQGACNHCGIWGHRLAECRKRDQELGKKGGAKGDKGAGKGGKGGPKGGKGPPAGAGPLNEVAGGGEADDWEKELAGDDGADEWHFQDAIASVTEWAPAKARRGARTWRPFGTQPCCASFSTLSSLTDDAEELMCAVTPETRGGGQVVEAVVDSGAVHSVAPPGAFPGRTRPSAWSRAGRGYRAANGTGIKNLGVVGVAFATAEGHKCAIPFQVAEVEQPLLSVSHLTSAGNRVELGHTAGRIVNLTTGRSIALERRGGVYILRMFIADGAAQLPFHRQGA